MDKKPRYRAVLATLCVVFALLTVVFALDLFGKPTPVHKWPLVDPEFLKTETWRRSYADLAKAGKDLDDYDCYLCHEEGKSPELKYDANNRIVVPDEHSDIVMGHGAHGRNNNCYNCHDDQNLLRLQARDGRDLKFDESTQLCGSCHGPTKEDWDAGAHGRISGLLGPGPRSDRRNRTA